MIEFLRRYGVNDWSARIEDDLFFVRKGDAYGAERFLTCFGGMGSINDLWLCQVNGNPVPRERESEINAQLEALRSRAWQLAKTVANDAAAEPGGPAP